MLKFEKEKYLKILEAEGLSAALTSLHRDTTQFEFQTFEGPEGYDPVAFTELEKVRSFSRELWNIPLEKQSGTYKA